MGALLLDLGEAPLGEAVARVRILETWPADPRVARTLAQLVEAQPFPQSSLNWLWPLVFRLLSALADVRTVDPLRQVFADWLLEKGDARGEFIQLQFKQASGQATGKDVARAARLQKQHAADWLGDAGRALGRCEFERGFLVSCALVLTTTPSVDVRELGAWLGNLPHSRPRLQALRVEIPGLEARVRRTADGAELTTQGTPALARRLREGVPDEIPTTSNE